MTAASRFRRRFKLSAAFVAAIAGCRVPDEERVKKLDEAIATLGSAVQAGGPRMAPGSPEHELVNQAVKTDQETVWKVSR